MTLSRLFYASLLALTLLLGLLFYLFLDSSKQSIVESSERLREAHTRRIAANVESYLDQAQQAIAHIETELQHDACGAGSPQSIAPCLEKEILSNANLAEATATHAEAPWQMSYFRDSAAEGAMIGTRITFEENGHFVSEVRRGDIVQRMPAGDPTRHPTFTTPSTPSNYGGVIWSDLSFTELDARLPEEKRRVVVTVMKTIEDRQGRFAGVLRIGLLTEKIDALVREESAANAPHEIFICDDMGRLIARLTSRDRLAEDRSDESLRVVPAKMPPEIAAALRSRALAQVSPRTLNTADSIIAGGQPYFVSFRGLPQTQGWRVGIVVPQEYYFGRLHAIRNRLIAATLALIIVILLGGTLTLRLLRRGLRQIQGETAQMRRFVFAPSAVESPFRDVGDVLRSLDQAKTAMRAMGKYVPVGLVRQLYEANREPVLGGELRDVSLMFTDIKDFTTLAERLSPDVLARNLGSYLEVMTNAIQANAGTVDKYIGDAVMVIWNAPADVADHPLKACSAALACVEATRSASPELVTRFGLHRDTVMVGHFGAPDRMSFTAIGDGVNLASRLEGLNKQYGTQIIVSETIYAAAKEQFAFRHLDRVAVKGKSRGIEVYELLQQRVSAAERYEEALAKYFLRDFAGALAILEQQLSDPPSAVLAGRCRRMLNDPPPPDWDGIYVSSVK